jgi:hypothetical protein
VTQRRNDVPSIFHEPPRSTTTDASVAAQVLRRCRDRVRSLMSPRVQETFALLFGFLLQERAGAAIERLWYYRYKASEIPTAQLILSVDIGDLY